MTGRAFISSTVGAVIAVGLLAGSADAAGAPTDLGSWAKAEGLSTTWRPSGRPIIVTEVRNPSPPSGRDGGTAPDDAGIAWVSGRGGIRAHAPVPRASGGDEYVLTHARHRARAHRGRGVDIAAIDGEIVSPGRAV